MKKRNIAFMVLIMIVLIVSMACNLGKSTSSKDSNEIYTSDEGGFSFQILEDYTVNEVLAGVEMVAPDGIPEVGPGMQLYGGITDQEQTTDELWELVTDPEIGLFEFEKPKKYKVDGVNGLIAEFKGEQAGEAVKGKIFLVMVKPDQQFFMFGIAPEDDWKRFVSIYDKVLDTVKFHDAIPIDYSYEEPEEWTFEEDPESVDSVPTEVIVEGTGIISQWASSAMASTEYSSNDWSAMQATGEPDVIECGSNPKAWSPAYVDTEEYIELFYDVPVIPTEIVIYQSFNPSQVVEIQLVDTDGEEWLLWYGNPEEVSDCPDMWTHTIELEETFLVNSIVIFVEQSILGLGGVEIDAVELVGYLEGSEVIAPSVVEESSGETGQDSSASSGGSIPTNYSGLMAGPVYQGWINIIVNETKEADLDKIMTIPGKKSTDSWKPRPDHKQTYLYEMPWAKMTGFISVTTDGIVYKKSVSSNTHPTDFELSTVNRSMYEELDAIYKRDKVIPYEVMANMLGSPGFLYEQYYRPDDGKMISQYTWYNADRDRISGYFLDGLLTGMAGLNFIESE
ncbi:MAG: hypothetical protein Q7U53_19160 [Anaerolineaceae bacterium]|nr:hypothetical protein [Anaerolineaceae bacterium]